MRELHPLQEASAHLVLHMNHQFQLLLSLQLHIQINHYSLETLHALKIVFVNPCLF